MNLRAALAALMRPNEAGETATAEQIVSEAHALRIDNQIEALQREGLLNADEASVNYARTAIERDGDAYINHIRQARPQPAAPAATINPTAPPDETEAAIQALVETGMPYHEAAAEVSKGSDLKDR